MVLAKLAGIVGLVCIICGILQRKKGKQDVFYMVGGVLLTIYSIALGDPIFITLQIVFTLVAAFDYYKSRKRG